MRQTATSPDLFEAPAIQRPLLNCPNPKPSQEDKAAFGRLASLYTAFSSEFATFALDLCQSLGHSRIGDPFAGMGTIGEAARPYPITLSLNDLNPFAVTSCALRTGSSEDISKAVESVRALLPASETDNHEQRFKQAADLLLPDGLTIKECFESPASEEARHFLRCLHILSAARITAHKRLKGSNPTWTKRLSAKAGSDVGFEEALGVAIKHVLSYAAQLPARSECLMVDLANEDIAALGWQEGSLDAIVTSPPYPNRTDYIRHYLPAAELLLSGDQDAERILREVQIGTPLIRQNHDRMQLPDSAETLIERVRTHRSYASERYYAKGFRYYFEDMARALAQFARWLAPNGTVILVVQDTYYKEILVPVAELLGDIAQVAGLTLVDHQPFKVRNAMSRLSPHSRASIPKPLLEETVMLLTKR